MSSPTPAHERRVLILDALARLSGYSAPAAIPGLVPDVLLASGASLFLGEAKETETPGGGATRERLSRYVRHLHRRPEDDVLVLCVSGQAGAWADMVRRLTRNMTGSAWTTHVTHVSLDEWLIASRPSRAQVARTASVNGSSPRSNR